MRADWRVLTLDRMRKLILEADPGMIEERKWKKPSNLAGVPVWSHHGMVCTGETYKQVVKLTFAPDSAFLPFLPLIELRASDDRNYVKKRVSWALRSLGRRPGLNRPGPDSRGPIDPIRGSGSHLGRPRNDPRTGERKAIKVTLKMPAISA